MRSSYMPVRFDNSVRWSGVRFREVSGVRPTLAALWGVATGAVRKPTQSKRGALSKAIVLLTVIACVPTFVRGLETNELSRLAPPYAELPPTFWEQHGSLVVFGGIVILGVVAMLVWLASHPKPVPPMSPEVRARRALEALQGRTEDGVLLSEVSQILRRYFVAAFGMSSGEFTTAEFCRLIGGNEALGVELSSALVKFLETCDVRKFAPPASAAPLNAVAQARELFERAEARRAPLAAAQTRASA